MCRYNQFSLEMRQSTQYNNKLRTDEFFDVFTILQVAHY
jgi:hypothetical protein